MKRSVYGVRWFYCAPGMVYAVGPSTERFTTERAARAYWRRVWNAVRLSKGAQVWRE